MQKPSDRPERRQGHRYAKVVARYALLLWVVSCLLPAGKIGDRIVYGWELALHAFNPMLIFFEGFVFLAAWTNLILLSQAGRIATRRKANAGWLVISFVINVLALAQAASARPPVIAWDGFTVVAPLLWLAAFVTLIGAALGQDEHHGPAAPTAATPPDFARDNSPTHITEGPPPP